MDSTVLGGSKVDVELVANLQCKSKACFLAYLRQFKIRRMFTLQLQRQKSKKLRPWERSHWKADKFATKHRVHTISELIFLSLKFMIKHKVWKKIWSKNCQNRVHPVFCGKFYQLFNGTVPKAVSSCFFVAGAVE